MASLQGSTRIAPPPPGGLSDSAFKGNLGDREYLRRQVAAQKTIVGVSRAAQHSASRLNLKNAVLLFDSSILKVCIDGSPVTGIGTFTYGNKHVYDGKFKDGLRHGSGTLTNSRGEIISTGIWTNDLFVWHGDDPLGSKISKFK